jgi:hypothetical protein
MSATDRYSNQWLNTWGTTYWRVWNFLVRDLGLVSLLVGGVFIGLGTARLIEREYFFLDAVDSLVVLPIGLLIAGIGWAIVRASSYRPDLGDSIGGFDPFGAKARKAATPTRRSWWTGEPLG